MSYDIGPHDEAGKSRPYSPDREVKYEQAVKAIERERARNRKPGPQGSGCGSCLLVLFLFVLVPFLHSPKCYIENFRIKLLGHDISESYQCRGFP